MPQTPIQTKSTYTEEKHTSCLPKDRRTSLKEKVCMAFPYVCFMAYALIMTSAGG